MIRTLHVAASGTTNWVCIGEHADFDAAFAEGGRIRRESGWTLDIQIFDDGDPVPAYTETTSAARLKTLSARPLG